MNTALDKYDNAIYVLHLTSNVLSSIMRHPPKATFFPYTTLFRSPRSRFPRLAVPRPVRAGPPRRGACDHPCRRSRRPLLDRRRAGLRGRTHRPRRAPGRGHRRQDLRAGGRAGAPRADLSGGVPQLEPADRHRGRHPDSPRRPPARPRLRPRRQLGQPADEPHPHLPRAGPHGRGPRLGTASARDDRVDRSRGRLRPTGDTAGAARGGRAARIQGGSIALSRRRLSVDPRVGALIEPKGSRQAERSPHPPRPRRSNSWARTASASSLSNAPTMTRWARPSPNASRARASRSVQEPAPSAPTSDPSAPPPLSARAACSRAVASVQAVSTAPVMISRSAGSETDFAR